MSHSIKMYLLNLFFFLLYKNAAIKKNILSLFFGWKFHLFIQIKNFICSMYSLLI